MILLLCFLRFLFRVYQLSWYRQRAAMKPIAAIVLLPKVFFSKSTNLPDPQPANSKRNQALNFLPEKIITGFSPGKRGFPDLSA
jgi:hypothetical protein